MPAPHITRTPAGFGATLALSFEPEVTPSPRPAPLGTSLVVSFAPAPMVSARPSAFGTTLALSMTGVAVPTAVPRAHGASLVIEQPGAGARPFESGGLPMALGASLIISQSDPPDYDATNRMTSVTYRDRDFTRFSDVKQLLKNLRFVLSRFTEDHALANGGHAEKRIADFAGYAASRAFPMYPPLRVGSRQVHLVRNTGLVVTTAFILDATVGQSVNGIYEVTVGFGGEKTWSAYAVVTKVSQVGI